MTHFDVILNMEYPHLCYPLVDSRNRIVQFQLPNEPIIKYWSSTLVPKSLFVFYLKENNMISMECIILFESTSQILKLQFLSQFQ